jgi:uncharacterized protein YdaU (DUF1376 family)
VSNKPPKDYTGTAPIYHQWGDKEFMYDTRHMHWQARMMYRELLQAAWHLSTRPDLPDDESVLQNILGVPKEVWEQRRTAVLAMLTHDPATGVLWQKRLRRDWKAVTDYRQKQKDLANRRWSKDAKAMPTHIPTESQEDAKPIPAKQRLGKVRLGKEKKSKAENSTPAPTDERGGVSIPTTPSPFSEAENSTSTKGNPAAFSFLDLTSPDLTQRPRRRPRQKQRRGQ